MQDYGAYVRRLEETRQEATTTGNSRGGGCRGMATWGGCGVSVSVCEGRRYGLLDMSTRWSCLSGWASRICGPFVLFGVVNKNIFWVHEEGVAWLCAYIGA